MKTASSIVSKEAELCKLLDTVATKLTKQPVKKQSKSR